MFCHKLLPEKHISNNAQVVDKLWTHNVISFCGSINHGIMMWSSIWDLKICLIILFSWHCADQWTMSERHVTNHKRDLDTPSTATPCCYRKKWKNTCFHYCKITCIKMKHTHTVVKVAANTQIIQCRPSWCTFNAKVYTK